MAGLYQLYLLRVKNKTFEGTWEDFIDKEAWKRPNLRGTTDMRGRKCK